MPHHQHHSRHGRTHQVPSGTCLPRDMCVRKGTVLPFLVLRVLFSTSLWQMSAARCVYAKERPITNAADLRAYLCRRRCSVICSC